VTHAESVARAARWMKNQNFRYTVSEKMAIGIESPDVIGWKYGGNSTLIECKVSRADFLADKKKPFRIKPELGMGLYRYYMCPAGMIQLEDLPPKWGLLWIDGKRIMKLRAFGNGDMENRFEDRNVLAELAYLNSFTAKLTKYGVDE